MKDLNQYLRVIVVILVAVAASYIVAHPHVADVSASDHGTVSEEGTVRFHSGLFLGINPDPGYRASVYVDGELADYDGSGTFLYRTNVFDFDTHKIHVNFERISSLYVHCNTGGSVTPNGNVFATGEVRIIATPDEGYVIEDLSINGVSKGSINIIDIVVSEPTDVMVKFRQAVEEDHTVNISVTSSVSIPEGYGTIIPNGKFMIPAGGSFVISISLNPGYELKQVYVNGAPYLNTQVALFAYDVSALMDSVDIRVDNVDENTIVEIVVGKIIEPGESFTLDIKSGDGGTTNPSGKVSVEKGSDLSISMIPDSGYEVSAIIIDGTAYVVSGNTFVIKDITKNMAVEVMFTKIIKGIQIDSLPAKTTYVVGDKLDITGLKVSLVYADGSSTPISSDNLVISPMVLDKVGKQEISIVYDGYYTTFVVTVKSVSEVFGVTVDSFDGEKIDKRLNEYPIKFGVFEPGMSKDLVLKINVEGSSIAYLKLEPITFDKELTDKIIVAIDGNNVGTLTELLSGQYSLGTITSSKTLIINFSFPHGDNDGEALEKGASFTMAILASSV